MRCKGRVYAHKDGLLYEYLLQGVEDLFELREMGSVKPPFEHRLLFVGKHINEESLKTEIEKRCFKVN
jgi:hypothetical protein